MSVLRPRPPEDPIELVFDPSRRGPLEPAALARAAREVAAAVASASTPAGTLLEEYMTRRRESRLFAWLAEARRLREEVDRLVVVAERPLLDAIRGVFESGCHPYHNELSRGERGGRPRLAFDDGSPDGTRGLLDITAAMQRRGDDLLDRTGLVVIEPLGEPAATAAAAHRESLAAGLDGDRQGHGGLSPQAACARTATLDGHGSVFGEAVVVPAAAAGCDVVRLLGGAAAIERRCREESLGNPATILAAARRLLAAQPGGPAELVLDAGLLPAAESLARWQRGRLPSAGSPRPLFAWSLEPLEPRREPWPLTEPKPPGAGCAEIGRLRLPRLDEHTAGQLLAMVCLADG